MTFRSPGRGGRLAQATLDLRRDPLAQEAKIHLDLAVNVADMPETSRLFNTICAWSDALEVLIVTRATKARTEAANMSIKHINRTDRDFRTGPTTAPASCTTA